MSWVPESGPFPYIHEAFEYLETNWCADCAFRKTEGDTPMCDRVESQILLECEPVEEVDTATGTPLRCNIYKRGEPTPEQTEGQIPLWI